MDRNKTLSTEKYPNKVVPYFNDIINYLKKSDSWKIQLRLAINFMYPKNNHEQNVIHLTTVTWKS